MINGYHSKVKYQRGNRYKWRKCQILTSHAVYQLQSKSLDIQKPVLVCFFGHIMEKKYTDNHGKYHATVLILESIGTNRRAYFFNPYKLKSDSLPVLVGKIVRSWSRTITHVTCITGRQYHGTVTCVHPCNSICQTLCAQSL